MSNYFQNIYYNPPHPAAYTGLAKLKSTVSKNKKGQVRKWLESQDAYNFHTPVRRKFPRRYYNVQNIDDCWEMDLIDFR